MALHNIGIQRAAKLSTFKYVAYVEGVQWARIEMRKHGAHGTSYTIRDAAGKLMVEPGEKTGPVTVHSDSLAYHLNRSLPVPSPSADQRAKNLKVRLALTIQYCIDQGLLRSPDVAMAERRTTVDKRTAAEKQRREEVDAAWSRKAHEVVAKMQAGACGEVLAGEIVQLMKWAQSQ